MSKVKQYIEEAVKATRNDTEAAGCVVQNCKIDSGVHVHADEAINTLNVLAQAALENNCTLQVLSKAVTETMSVNHIENNSNAIQIEGIDEKPRFFKAEVHE